MALRYIWIMPKQGLFDDIYIFLMELEQNLVTKQYQQKHEKKGQILEFFCLYGDNMEIRNLYRIFNGVCDGRKEIFYSPWTSCIRPCMAMDSRFHSMRPAKSKRGHEKGKEKR